MNVIGASIMLVLGGILLILAIIESKLDKQTPLQRKLSVAAAGFIVGFLAIAIYIRWA